MSHINNPHQSKEQQVILPCLFPDISISIKNMLIQFLPSIEIGLR